MVVVEARETDDMQLIASNALHAETESELGEVCVLTTRSLSSFACDPCEAQCPSPQRKGATIATPPPSG